MLRVPSAVYNVYSLFISWPKLCLLSTYESGKRQGNMHVITEVEPLLRHQNVLEKACFDAVCPVCAGSPVFCQMLMEFLLVEHGPVPSVWCHSPTFWPPAENRQMHFGVFCLSFSRKTLTEEQSRKNVVAYKKDLKTHIFDVIGGDGLAIHVDGSFCDDDDVKPRPGCAALEVNAR